MFIPTLKVNHKFRFLNSSGSTKTITRAELLNLYCMATGTTTSSRIIEAIRVKSIEIWTNPPALGAAPLTVSVEWVGVQAPSTIISDTSMGVLPAHVRTRPPPRSSDQWWSMTGQNENDPLMTIIAPAESVLDLQVAIRFVDNEAATSGDSPTGANSGQVYFNYLDGIAGATWAPVSASVLP
jgi:hypothetical protein